MRSATILWLASLLSVALTLPAWADCKVHTDDHVVLASSTDDPDVLVWDTRPHLRDYHEGSFDEARQLSPHALLVPPGTRAIVEACVPSYVQSQRLPSPEDAVGIVIVSGPDRGDHGWVLGSDVRTDYHLITSPSP